jgi:hypothetical protein
VCQCESELLQRNYLLSEYLSSVASVARARWTTFNDGAIVFGIVLCAISTIFLIFRVNPLLPCRIDALKATNSISRNWRNCDLSSSLAANTSLLCLIAYSQGLFSNSFILSERRVTYFLLVTLILIYSRPIVRHIVPAVQLLLLIVAGRVLLEQAESVATVYYSMHLISKDQFITNTSLRLRVALSLRVEQDLISD